MEQMLRFASAGIDTTPEIENGLASARRVELNLRRPQTRFWKNLLQQLQSTLFGRRAGDFHRDGHNQGVLQGPDERVPEESGHRGGVFALHSRMRGDIEGDLARVPKLQRDNG
jgi:hypothetical protein